MGSGSGVRVRVGHRLGVRGQGRQRARRGAGSRRPQNPHLWCAGVTPRCLCQTKPAPLRASPAVAEGATGPRPQEMWGAGDRTATEDARPQRGRPYALPQAGSANARTTLGLGPGSILDREDDLRPGPRQGPPTPSWQPRALRGSAFIAGCSP